MRALAEEFRIEAVGLERDLDLARLGMALVRGAPRRAARAGRGLSIPNPSTCRSRATIACSAREATYLVREKERFWRVVMQGLRTGGTLVATEFVRSGAGGDAGRARSLGVGRRPPAAAVVARALRGLPQEPGIRASAPSPISRPTIARWCYRGWARLMQRPELHRLPRRAFGPIIDEAERSLRLVRAFDSGALRLIRLHAVAR